MPSEIKHYCDRVKFYSQNFWLLFPRVWREIIYSHGLVSYSWLFKVKLQLLFNKKIKVGFGPITSSEKTLSTRKWRIDPIIDELNAGDSKYCAGFFFHAREMRKFDIIVIVKEFNPAFIPVIAKLKKKNLRFIYDIVDNPNCGRKYRYFYKDHPEFCSLMDGFILSTPLHEPDVVPYSKKYVLIEHPVINESYVKKYSDNEEIYILAHGFYKNIENTKSIEPIIQNVSHKLGKKIWLIYHSEMVLPDTQWVKYIKWTVANSFTVMQQADIAVTIKDLENPLQVTKPSTKVLAFMAAGLPVVCTPTEADKLIIKEGVNGFFAYNPNDWERILMELAQSADYREQIGRIARNCVLHDYSVKNITKKYIQLFDRVTED